MRFSLVVPTLNASGHWPRWYDALRDQNSTPEKVIILDSESTDGTQDTARAAGYEVIKIERSTFDHGGTRQKGLSYLPENTEVVVYLTQDSILAGPDALRNIVAAFEDPTIGVAYGRQLPRPVAGSIEAHARIYNYPAAKETRTYDDRARLGIKAPFSSDSFAAYRLSALTEVGGFPTRAIASEDLITAANIMRAGWKLSYAADAMVYHSHGYSVMEEFRRYFDIGVLHSHEGWLLTEFGKPEGEGTRFLRSELSYLSRNSPALIPISVVKTLAKYLGYRLGRAERYVLKPVKVSLSMNKNFWKRSIG
jgi:rhamnosyltransferase